MADRETVAVWIGVVVVLTVGLALLLWLWSARRTRPSSAFVPPPFGQIVEVRYVSLDSGGASIRLQRDSDETMIWRILHAIQNPTSRLPSAIPDGMGASLEFRLRDGSVQVLAVSPDAQRREALLLDGSLRMSRELWDIYLELEERIERDRGRGGPDAGEPAGED